MPISDLLLQGVNLMLLGMGMVFTFLAVLVLAMIGMSRLAQAMAGEEAHESPVNPPATITPGMDTSEELVAVISAAINRYRPGQP